MVYLFDKGVQGIGLTDELEGRECRCGRNAVAEHDELIFKLCEVLAEVIDRIDLMFICCFGCDCVVGFDIPLCLRF